jgi:hypothetical protein
MEIPVRAGCFKNRIVHHYYTVQTVDSGGGGFFDWQLAVAERTM